MRTTIIFERYGTLLFEGYGTLSKVYIDYIFKFHPKTQGTSHQSIFLAGKKMRTVKQTSCWQYSTLSPIETLLNGVINFIYKT